jgi:hypothetical protein
MAEQLGWVLCVCLAFFGWGFAFARALGLPRDLGSAGCLGVAWAVCFGGVINLLQMMGTLAALAFVLPGAVFALIEFWPSGSPSLQAVLPSGPLARLLLAATVLLAALGILGHLYYPEFNKYDDYSAYLVFPQKLLTTGSLGFEPFSERRLWTSVGGMYFLHALILAGANFFFLHAIDPALALGLILLLLDAGLRRQRASPGRRLGVALFALLLMPSVINLTAIVLPVALMLYAYLLLEADPEVEPGPQSARRIIALGLVAAALIAIKPAYLPWVGGFLAFVYGRRMVAKRFAARELKEPAGIAAVTLAALLPWMLANLRDVATLLYPVLGIGFSAARYGLHPSPWTLVPSGGYVGTLLHEMRIIGPQLLACGLFFAFSPRHGRERGTAMLTLAFLLSGLALVATIVIATGASEIVRYSYPAVAGGMMVACYHLAATARSPLRPFPAVVVAMTGVLAVASGTHGLIQYYGHAVTNLGILVIGPSVRPAMLANILSRDAGAERDAVARMQQAIPAGVPFLERLDYPFLLDFRRNTVLVADYPGATGLPPGMPVFQGPEKLAAYLLGVSIRYVAYAYANEAEFSASDATLQANIPLIMFDAKLAFDFQDNLAALMRTRRVGYDDGKRAVIDLAERRDE